MTVEVEPVVTADLPIPKAYALRGAVRGILDGRCLAFIVRHPGAGTILVDTGFHPDALTNLRRDFGIPMSVMFSRLRPRAPFDEQLRDAGIEPADVERVLMTHLHVDHTSAMRLLPNARFTCAREEWRAATGRGAGALGFVGGHLPPESRMDLVDFGADGEPHEPFSRTIDLLGDGSIRLVSTPGHTPGHLSVLLRASGDRTVLLAGDAAYTRQNVTEQRLPLITADAAAAARSLREIGALADVTLVPSHDPTAWEDLQP